MSEQKPLTERQIQHAFTLQVENFAEIMRHILSSLMNRHLANGVPANEVFDKAHGEQVKLRQRAEFLYKLMSKPRDPDTVPIARYGLVLLRLVHEGQAVDRILLIGKSQIAKQLDTLDGWLDAYQVELDELAEKYRAEHPIDRKAQIQALREHIEQVTERLNQEDHKDGIGQEAG